MNFADLVNLILLREGREQRAQQVLEQEEILEDLHRLFIEETVPEVREARQVIHQDILNMNVQPQANQQQQPVQQQQQPVPPGQVPRFRVQARTENELFALDTLIQPEQRAAVDDGVLAKYKAKAIEPLPSKFGLMKSDDDQAQLDNTYNVSMRVNEFRKRLSKFGIAGPFTLVTPDPNIQGDLLAETADLLSDHARITLETTLASTRFYSTYGQDYDVQDLKWSQELLENSCEPELRDKVLERMMQLDDFHQGGPTYFHIMIGILTSASPESIRALLAKVKDMNIRDIPGENVDKAVSQLRLALAKLTVVNEVPNDIMKQLEKVFQTTSVPQFNELFAQLDKNRRLRVTGAPTTPEEIMVLAEDTYHEFRDTGLWTGVASGNATFHSNTGSSTPYKKTCWNCGEPGHSMYDCQKPQDTQRQERMRKEYNDRRGASDGSGRGGNDGRGNQGGRGRGRGRGRGGRGQGRGGRGRGRSGGRGSDSQNPPPKPLMSNMNRAPTKKGQNKILHNGVEHTWCHHCQCYMPDHETTSHDFSKAYTHPYDMVASTPKTTPDKGAHVSNFANTVYTGAMLSRQGSSGN